jgi:2-methylcitrate dehydratase PrpD
VRVRTTDGVTFEEEVRYFRGHARNPLSPEELAAKFHAVVDPVLGGARASRLLDVLHGIGSAPDVRAIAVGLEGGVKGV